MLAAFTLHTPRGNGDRNMVLWLLLHHNGPAVICVLHPHKTGHRAEAAAAPGTSICSVMFLGGFRTPCSATNRRVLGGAEAVAHTW